MPSEKPKSKREIKQAEKRLYEPIKNDLERQLLYHVRPRDKNKTYIPMREPPRIFPEKDVHLEVTADAKGRFSDMLERELDDDALYILKVEKVSPDITGFVRRKLNTKEIITEIITVEVKAEPIKISHFHQAKFYQDIFKATYGLLVSNWVIPERIKRFALRRSDIRGNLILAQYLEPLHVFRSHADFEPHIPELFKQFTKPI